MGPSYEERAAANDRSLLNAENHGQIWSSEEDDLIRETMDEPVADVAYVLGRSIFATDLRRSHVRLARDSARAAWRNLGPRGASGSAYLPGETCARCGLIHPGEC